MNTGDADTVVAREARATTGDTGAPTMMTSAARRAEAADARFVDGHPSVNR